jgi:tRNA threonylcarbamoyladenosine biosynthesis protein TsaE
VRYLSIVSAQLVQLIPSIFQFSFSISNSLYVDILKNGKAVSETIVSTKVLNAQLPDYRITKYPICGGLYLCQMDAIFTLSQLPQVARAIWKEGKQKKIWAFHAPMGAGKTTFIHALCEELGVVSAISSPTFAIINEYKSKEAGAIYHMDWYRLKNEEEAVNAGVEDSLLSKDLCLVEWPENAAGLLPDDTFHIHIEVLDPETRRLFTGVLPGENN